MMRSFPFKFIIFLLIVGGYFYFFSLLNIESDRLCVIEDLRNNKIVKIVHGRNNFVWQAAFPWWFSMYQLQLKKTLDVEMILQVPGLEGLKGDIYFFKIFYTVIYKINLEKFTSFTKLGKGFSELEDDIRNGIKYLMIDELNRYMTPVYRGYAISNDRESINGNMQGRMKIKYEQAGIDILAFDIPGRIIVPDAKTYDDGLRHIARIREIDKKNEMLVKSLEGKISQDKLLDRQKYEKLIEMSKLIKENHDILKYIYIDKISDKIKVIVSSDKNIFPIYLDDKKSDKHLKEDINNLD